MLSGPRETHKRINWDEQTGLHLTRSAGFCLWAGAIAENALHALRASGARRYARSCCRCTSSSCVCATASLCSVPHGGDEGMEKATPVGDVSAGLMDEIAEVRMQQSPCC